MKTMKLIKGFSAVLGSAVLGLTIANVAVATNPEQVPVEVEWIAPVVIAENNALQFGLLDVGASVSDTVTINTDDTYSESAANTVVGGTQAAADLTVTVANSTPITILVDNIGSGTYYTLGTFLCSYESGADTACDSAYDVTSSASSSTGDTLEIGATLTVSGAPSAGTDDTTFDVTITYQ